MRGPVYPDGVPGIRKIATPTSRRVGAFQGRDEGLLVAQSRPTGPWTGSRLPAKGAEASLGSVARPARPISTYSCFRFRRGPFRAGRPRAGWPASGARRDVCPASVTTGVPITSALAGRQAAAERGMDRASDVAPRRTVAKSMSPAWGLALAETEAGSGGASRLGSAKRVPDSGWLEGRRPRRSFADWKQQGREPGGRGEDLRPEIEDGRSFSFEGLLKLPKVIGRPGGHTGGWSDLGRENSSNRADAGRRMTSSTNSASAPSTRAGRRP